MPYDNSTQKKYGENPLQKRSGFKMKYNNSAFPFKESPAKQADAELTKAADNLGESNEPKDLSGVWEKNFEGIIAANDAKFKMYGDIVQGISENVGKVVTAMGKKEDKEA